MHAFQFLFTAGKSHFFGGNRGFSGFLLFQFLFLLH